MQLNLVLRFSLYQVISSASLPSNLVAFSSGFNSKASTDFVFNATLPLQLPPSGQTLACSTISGINFAGTVSWMPWHGLS